MEQAPVYMKGMDPPPQFMYVLLYLVWDEMRIKVGHYLTSSFSFQQILNNVYL